MLIFSKKPQFILSAFLIFLATTTRLLPHPPNFTPIFSCGLFSGSLLPAVFGIPVILISFFLSDLYLGFHNLMWLTYSLSLWNFWIGKKYLKTTCWEKKLTRIIPCSLLGSLIFFIFSNLGVFLFSNLYPFSWQGLQNCWIAAIPFFQNQLLGDLFFTYQLFAFQMIGEYFVSMIISRKAN